MDHTKKLNFIFKGMGSHERILRRVMVDMSLEGHLSDGEWTIVGRSGSRETSWGTIK